ncbi:MAG: ABC transporter substrate-binding protein, partial [Candidatus Dormibacteraeota bacterium]|nr:ABC transporter substrate-binding protein [Candidatus Dormibacteraeota bacterium]
ADGWLAGTLTRRQALGRLLGLGLTLSSASAFLAACSGGSSGGGQGQTSTKPSVAIGIVQEPTSLDPTAQATASISLLLRDNVYEGLVRLSPDLQVVPGLAKSWDVSSDGRNFTFHLASGVKWHDGSPFTAQDVKFSWDRAMNPSTNPVNPHMDYWAPVQSVDVAGDGSVKVTLKQYSDNWLFHMTSGAASIVSSKTATQNANAPVGTGPFKFAIWNKGASLGLVRNDGYWSTKALLKNVTFKFITDANAMNNALKAGDIDAIGQVGGYEQVGAFKSDSRFKVLEGPPVGKIIVAMNNAGTLLSNLNMRRAISLAINPQAWIQAILFGYGVPIGSHSVPNNGEPYYVDETGVNPFNAAMAQQSLSRALRELGLAQPPTLRLAVISDFPYAVTGSEILGSQLQAIGLRVNPEQMPFARWLKQVFSPPQDYDLTIINHAEERDIGNYANPKYYWHYNNSQVTQWLAQADAEPDSAKRKALYAQVQKQLATDAANAFVMSPKTLAVVAAKLQGYPVVSLSSPLFLRDTHFS